MRRLFVDTSAWFAFANRSDPSHQAVAEVLREREARFVTSNFVFDETVTLCAYRLGRPAAVRVGEVLRDAAAADLVHVSPADEEAAWALFVARHDKAYSFTDCTSFVLMRRLGIDTAVALDADFQREGFALRP